MRRSLQLVELILHVLFWVAPTVLIIHYDAFSGGELLEGPYMPVPFLVQTLFNMAVFYMQIWVLYPAKTKGRLSLRWYVVVIVFVLVGGTLAKMGIYLLSCYVYFSTFAEPEMVVVFLAESTSIAFIVLVSFLYAVAKHLNQTNTVNQRLREEKLSLELKYLKAQLKPHFLFNTLNNLYSLAIRNADDETATGIAKLADMMRYLLNDVNEATVPLEREIAFLQSYIELQMLRFAESDAIQIRFDVQGDPTPLEIPPFLLIVFVENAFQHGVNYKARSLIEVLFVCERERLRFSVVNTVHRQSHSVGNGYGLKNVAERLQLTFPDRFRLDTSEDDHTFRLSLELELN
jgi:two-component system, LytTR family, sensor kinase